MWKKGRSLSGGLIFAKNICSRCCTWGICDKLNMLIWLLSDFMGPALTTFTAQNLGAKNKERIRKGVFVGAAFMTPWFVSAQDAATLAPLVGVYARMMAPFSCFMLSQRLCREPAVAREIRSDR